MIWRGSSCHVFNLQDDTFDLGIFMLISNHSKDHWRSNQYQFTLLFTIMLTDIGNRKLHDPYYLFPVWQKLHFYKEFVDHSNTDRFTSKN